MTGPYSIAKASLAQALGEAEAAPRLEWGEARSKGEATDTEWGRGLAGLGCGYHTAHFGSFSVTPIETVP